MTDEFVCEESRRVISPECPHVHVGMHKTADTRPSEKKKKK